MVEGDGGQLFEKQKLELVETLFIYSSYIDVIMQKFERKWVDGLGDIKISIPSLFMEKKT